MDAGGTHARVEEDEKKKALDTFRLRSSARLGFASSSGTTTAAAAAAATATATASASTSTSTVAVSCSRLTRRKRKKRRRQRRNSSNEDKKNVVVVVDSSTTTTTTTTTTTVPTSSSTSSTAIFETTARRDETTRATSHGESSWASVSDNNAYREQLDNEEVKPRIRQGVHTAGESQEHERTGGSSGTRAAASSVSAGITLLNRRTGKRSSRRCNASGRRNAMTMDLQRLITEVHARPAIWDQKNVNYHNRDVILKMWREIARACEVSTDVAKSKWKHLRDNFRNELKKTYRGKCESGGNEHDSKWVWFKSLFFLREQMNSRVIGCALSQNCSANLRSSPEGTQIEPQIDILEGHEETQFEDLDGDSCQSLLSNDEALHQVMPPPKLNKISRKRALIDATIDANDYTELDRKRYESLQKRLAVVHEEEDDTYHFLMSVRNPLRSLPIDRQMFVRLKIQELVYQEINSQNQQQQNQQNQQNRTYDQTTQDIKPMRISGGGGGGTATGNPGTNTVVGSGTTGNTSSGIPGNGAEVVSDMSNSATLLQNCTTEGSSDDAFFG